MNSTLYNDFWQPKILNHSWLGEPDGHLYDRAVSSFVNHLQEDEEDQGDPWMTHMKSIPGQLMESLYFGTCNNTMDYITHALEVIDLEDYPSMYQGEMTMVVKRMYIACLLPFLIMTAYYKKLSPRNSLRLLQRNWTPSHSLGDNFLDLIKGKDSYSPLESEMMDYVLYTIFSRNLSKLGKEVQGSEGRLEVSSHADDALVKGMKAWYTEIEAIADYLDTLVSMRLEKDPYKLMEVISESPLFSGLSNGEIMVGFQRPESNEMLYETIILKEFCMQYAYSTGQHSDYSQYERIAHYMAQAHLYDVKADRNYYGVVALKLMGIPRQLYQALYLATVYPLFLSEAYCQVILAVEKIDPSLRMKKR